MPREIDPETNWFFQKGKRDGFAGLRPIVPDETRHQWQRSGYFAGWEVGQEERTQAAEAMDG